MNEIPDLIERLLLAVEQGAVTQTDFKPCISRDVAREMVQAIARLYGCSADSTASFYAEDALMRTLGISQIAAPRGNVRQRWWKRRQRS